ncbi:MAG: glycosyltransferase family 4 protein [Bryobacteraceae bacterium]
MRIAIDATYSIDPFPSGIAVYSRELLKGLADQHPQDRLVECFRIKQWKQRPREIRENTSARILQWPLPIGKADIFHALNQRVDWRPASKVVSTFHDLFVMTAEYSTPEFRRRFVTQARTAAERSDTIIAVSRFTAEQVHSLLGVDRNRIRVVPHGVHLPAHPDRAKRENIILSVGALQLRKNTARLVEAFEKLNRPDWRLVLAGSPTGYGAEDIIEKIQRSTAKERIEIAGYVSAEQLDRLYSTAKVFAFVSLDEGFGIPILEAMAHRVPVLTSNRSALPEVCGDAAVTVDPVSTESIASSLELLTSDERLRNELREKGSRRAALFSWENCVRKTYEVYEELVR